MSPPFFLTSFNILVSSVATMTSPNFDLLALSTTSDIIDLVTIATTGDALNFGDLTAARRGFTGFSDVHGGLGD